jgi:predicted Fe-Mo cluster-binding NifX family protein
MRICIPTMDDQAQEALLSPHFGSAPFFTIIDSDTESFQVVTNRRASHAPGTCEAVRSLQEMAINVVICPGLGRRALASLQESGIAVFTSTAPNVAQAVAAYRGGLLAPLTAEAACQGGRHAGGHCTH